MIQQLLLLTDLIFPDIPVISRKKLNSLSINSLCSPVRLSSILRDKEEEEKGVVAI